MSTTRRALEAAAEALGNHNHVWPGHNIPAAEWCSHCKAVILVSAELERMRAAETPVRLCRYCGHDEHECECGRVLAAPARSGAPAELPRCACSVAIDDLPPGWHCLGMAAEPERREPAGAAMSEFYMIDIDEEPAEPQPESPERAALRELMVARCFDHAGACCRDWCGQCQAEVAALAAAEELLKP